MKHFLQVGFNWKKERPDMVKMETELTNIGIDWLRYAPNCWIIHTDANSKAWFDYLKKFLTGNEDHLLICRLNTDDFNGWMPKWVWDWINLRIGK
jgi:hypothetical protein